MSSPEGATSRDGEWGAPSARAGIELAAAAQSVPAARAFVAELLELWGREDPGRVVGLLTSEIVTNAVRYAQGTVWVEATMVGESTVRVAASDDHPDTPVLRPPDPYDEGGRGMVLVESLATRWGVQHETGHKVVWFEAPAIARHGGPHPPGH